jgi:toxin-antitoxin system PIN domain toxin
MPARLSMRCVDVNVLLYAHRPESPHHARFRSWLDSARGGAEPVGIAPIVESGFLRVATHPRVFADPTPLPVALAFLDALRSSPAVIHVEPSPRHWVIFRGLLEQIDAKGNDVPDAFLAALSIDLGATWISADRGFARFRGLRWQHPLDQ